MRSSSERSGVHAEDYGLEPGDASSRTWFRERISQVQSSPDEVRQGPWNPQRGGGEDYFFYRKEKDLLITKPDGEFVTMFLEGKPNTRHENAVRIYVREGLLPCKCLTKC